MHFRNLEKQLILRLKNQDNLLISTEGLPWFNNLMDELKEVGTTIYLKRPAKELAHRVLNSKKKRPLTDGKSEENWYYSLMKCLKKEAFTTKKYIL